MEIDSKMLEIGEKCSRDKLLSGWDEGPGATHAKTPPR